jgi:N-acetylglucosamine kinase-like BadF-type ATPase
VGTVYLGLDGGGTKTAGAAVDPDGRVLAEARAGPSTFKSLGLTAAAAVLAGLTAALVADVDRVNIARAGGRPAVDAGARVRVGNLVAGVADVDTAADRDALRTALAGALATRGVEPDRLEVVNDSVIALASGTGGLAPGIACIAGTGSVAFGLNGAGREARAGGWGPPFADGGSAYWIAFQAVGRALKLHDQGRGEAPLVRELLGASGCSSLAELLYGHLAAAEDGGAARHLLPRLAPAVEAAALAGDPDAAAVFAGAGAELAELVGVLARRLEMAAEPFDLVAVGGVWDARAPSFRARFEAELADQRLHARVVRARVAPAVGAALLARDLTATGRPCPAGLLADATGP